MAVLYDARGNEIAGALDLITGNSFTDVRPLTASLGVVNAETIVELNGQATALIDMRSAAFAGTLVVQGTIDGTNWFDLPVTNMATQQLLVNIILSGANAFAFAVHVAGWQAVRVRCSAYTSGAITVGIRATIADLRASLAIPFPTTLWITATAAANTNAAATAPAASAGLFHYITHISIYRNATAAVAGTATLIHTTSNLPGSIAWSVGNAIAAGGTEKDVEITFPIPLKSSVAATNTTVTCVAGGAGVLGRVNIGYFVGA